MLFFTHISFVQVVHMKQLPLHHDAGNKIISRCLFISNHTVQSGIFFHPEYLAVSFISLLLGFLYDKLTGIVNEHNTCSEQHCSYLYSDAFIRSLDCIQINQKGIYCQYRWGETGEGFIFRTFISISVVLFLPKFGTPSAMASARDIFEVPNTVCEEQMGWLM